MKRELYKQKLRRTRLKKEPWGLHPHPFPAHPRLITC